MAAIVSGAAAAKSRKIGQSSWISVAGWTWTPRWRVPENGCSSSSRLVATPKFAPAPRRPQNSSGSSSALARTTSPVGGHELDRAKAVDRQPEPSLEPADAATERQPGDARVADDPDRADEPMLLRRDVERAEERPAAGPSESPLRVDADGVHPSEVDDEAAVGRRVPDRAVTAAADRDLEVDLAAEANGGHDVVDVGGPDDDRRPSIEHRVPDASRIVVAGGIGRDDLAGE